MVIVSGKLPRWKVSLGFNIIASKADPRILGRMFAGIGYIADQIVIVADEKADRSLYDIAAGYGADIYFSRWSDDFALARNLALERTWTDYVAWLDADEWLSLPVASRIHNLMTSPRGLAYYVWQVSPTSLGYTIYTPQIRIFPRVPGLRWEIPIHEQILPSLMRSGVRTQLTDLRIEHLGYLDPDVVRRKHRRNLRLLKMRLRQNPGDRFTRSNYEKALAFGKYLKRVNS